MKRPLVLIGGLIGLVLIGAVVWYLASPLFIDSAVDDAFPFEPPGQEALAEVAAAKPGHEMDEEMPAEVAAQPLAVLQGQFQDADNFHQGSGSATVYQLPDGSHVLRFEDFNATNGPDLHVLLASGPAPTNRDELGDYVDLGSLKGNVGNQNYEIPAGTDVSQFRSVVIYCMPFHVVFSTATLG